MSDLPSPRLLYRALVRRDPAFEGVFFAAVKTTAIFCRPTCPARKPKARNVEYFARAADALRAGYRPCARCRPMARAAGTPDLVRRLLEEVDRAPTRTVTEAALRALGIDPSTARRQFRRTFGMTFHAYQRARRMGSAHHDLRNGETVMQAQLDHGYESASGFWDAFKRTLGAPPTRAGAVRCLYAERIDTPLGPMLALADDAGLHLLEFVDRRALESELAGLRRDLGCAITPGHHAFLAVLAAELKAYFDGAGRGFTVPPVIRGSAFEMQVWERLRTIPPGETRSYAEIAQACGRPQAVRAVGRANGRNRLCLIVPCHRVIRSDGALCGYGGGVWRKQWLLNHERAAALANAD